MDKRKVVKMFAENLRVERARKNISQEKLAEYADITPDYLHRLEKEKANPTLHVVVSIAAALGVGIEKLITPEMLKKEE